MIKPALIDNMQVMTIMEIYLISKPVFLHDHALEHSDDKVIMIVTMMMRMILAHVNEFLERELSQITLYEIIDVNNVELFSSP